MNNQCINLLIVESSHTKKFIFKTNQWISQLRWLSANLNNYTYLYNNHNKTHSKHRRYTEQTDDRIIIAKQMKLYQREIPLVLVPEWHCSHHLLLSSCLAQSGRKPQLLAGWSCLTCLQTIIYTRGISNSV